MSIDTQLPKISEKLPKIYIIYGSFNKCGHTPQIANVIHKSILSTKLADSQMIFIDDNYDMNIFDDATMMIFGSPTYMGSLYSGMKSFFEKSAKKWSEQKWLNKLAAGFSNSSFPSGDNIMALHQMMTFACQHGMLWVSMGIKNYLVDVKSNNKLGITLENNTQRKTDDTQSIDSEKVYSNVLGGYSGLLTHAASGNLTKENILSAAMFGQRLSHIVHNYKLISPNVYDFEVIKNF